MSAVMPWAASDCSMPTWIAPKLPPPARTNAVLTGLAASDADTASSPPRHAKRAALGGIIAVGEEGGLGATHLMSYLREQGPIATGARCAPGCGPQRARQLNPVVVGPGSRFAWPGRQ